MKPSINQTLQQELTAKKEGKLQEAELKSIAQVSEPKFSVPQKSMSRKERRKKLAVEKKNKMAIQKTVKAHAPSQKQIGYLLDLYQNRRFCEAKKHALEITQGFPKYQFGWKILGAVLKKTGRISEALFANQKSVQLAPKDAAAHINLGNTFKQLGRFNEAEESYTQAIVLKPEYAEAHSNLGVTLQELGRLEDAEASYVQAIALKPEYAEAHNNLGNTLQGLDKWEEAETRYTQAIALKPDFAEAHCNLANTLKKLERLDEAEASYKKAIALKPNHPEFNCNLGALLQRLGRFEAAEKHFRQALAIKPDYAKAYSNLGNTLRDLGRLDEAKESYAKAIALEPNRPEFHSNLGVTLQDLGELDEACSAYIGAINLNSNFESAYVNLGVAIKGVRFTSANQKFHQPFIQLLETGNFSHPSELAPSILSLLKHDPLISEFVLSEDFAFSLKEVTPVIIGLNRLKLLHHLMRLCPLPDLQFEKFFVTMRRLLLTNLDKLEDTPEIVFFLSTLALHCFTNEYIYFENDEEIQFVDKLESEIAQTISQSEQPQTTKILCLASYRPLHQQNWCKKLKAIDHLQEVKKRLIEDPLTEKKIANNITVLGELSDKVSLKVKKQYEQNPYPRWVKIGIPSRAKSIAEVCDDAELYLYCEDIKEVTAPDILVAGCGTGQHSIGTASRFSGCQVTAVDLSFASLAYAKRKTNELSIKNLNYWQADILNLNDLERKFDIIECVGVLHHTDNPMVGWQILAGLLKPGGLMKIGLYSDLARKVIAQIREQIASLKVETSEIDIRNFRQLLVNSNDTKKQVLAESNDFYSLSTLRDLIFHTQEHRFTLPQIEKCLNEVDLKFCGFEDKDAIASFRELHGSNANIHDMALWQKFEKKNPNAFARMYQFWCQKPAV